MSASSQNNGKKSSNNSSTVNTPASTPITNINGNNAQSSPPPNNAPKYGTLVPNRIFVGGISANTTESELLQLFSSYGTVKAAKIIQDRAGVSKGYGFITFESEDDARRPLSQAENIVLKERKLNIAPAIKKQPFSRTFDASSPPAVATGNPQFFFPTSAAVPYFQGGVAYYPQPAPPAPGDPSAQQPVYQPAPPVYPAQTGPQQTATYPPMMFPAQTFYMPQQYPMPMPYEYNYYQGNGGPPQYMVGSGQSGPATATASQCGPMPPTSNSPTRGGGAAAGNCFNQQIPYNPTTEHMFYNMSLYGATTMDGQPIYPTETYDITNGPYNEDTYNMVDGTIQDIDGNLVHKLDNEQIEQHVHQLPSILHHTVAQPPPPTRPLLNSSMMQQHKAGNLDELNEQKITNSPSPALNITSNKDNSINPQQQSSDTSRNTTTPVVSLLSIDQTQEIDYLSMQGGRRKKPPQQQSVASNNVTQMPYQPNGYNYCYPHHYNMPNFPNNSVAVLTSADVYRINNNRMMNGGVYDRMKKRRNFTERRDISSRSSLRTDSNSSASVVDENKNEEKTIYRSSSTPPDSSLPLTNNNYKINNRTYQNGGTFRSHNNSNNHRYNNYAPMPDQRGFINSRNFKSSSIQQMHKRSPPLNHQQTDNNLSTSQQVFTHNNNNNGQNNFVAPVRRSRKSIRRNAGPTMALNEIGAGDAPLPNNSDASAGAADACKKLETLKL